MEPQNYLKSVLLTGSNIKDLNYVQLGICEELGEISGKIKRYKRGDYKKEEFKSQIKNELGDLTWYLVLYNHINHTPIQRFKQPSNKRIMQSLYSLYKLNNYLIESKNPVFRGKLVESMVSSVGDLGWSFGFTMKDICQSNINKTMSRLQRNKIKGSGDQR